VGAAAPGAGSGCGAAAVDTYPSYPLAGMLLHLAAELKEEEEVTKEVHLPLVLVLLLWNGGCDGCGSGRGHP
jgi:hypothetical protein